MGYKAHVHTESVDITSTEAENPGPVQLAFSRIKDPEIWRGSEHEEYVVEVAWKAPAAEIAITREEAAAIIAFLQEILEE